MIRTRKEFDTAAYPVPLSGFIGLYSIILYSPPDFFFVELSFSLTHSVLGLHTVWYHELKKYNKVTVTKVS